jgi:bacterioferritin-associated ferredoxin
MFVCHCRAVTDRTIVGEIEAGAVTVDDVVARCGAGSTCGGCVTTIERLCEELLDRRHVA